MTFGPEVRIDNHPDGTTGGVDIIRLPSGRYGVVWEGKNTPLEPFKAWFSYSDNLGATWSDQVSISDSDAITPQFVRLECDTTGTVFAVWEDWRDLGWNSAYFSRSVDGGESWLLPNVKVNSEGHSGFNPSIASNMSGSRLVTTFVRLEESTVYSSYSTDYGNTWSTDVAVGDPTAQGQYYPVVASTGAQSFVALWKDERDTVSDLYCSITEDGGETWLSPNIPVPFGGNNPLSGSIRLFWDGAILHAFWIETYTTSKGTASEAYYSHSLNGGYDWLENPVRVDDSGPNMQIQHGDIWAIPSGDVFAVWCSMWNQSYPIYAVCSVSSDSGFMWSDTVRANPISGEARRCAVYGNSDNKNILLAWSNLANQNIYCAFGSDLSQVEQTDEESSLTVNASPFSTSVCFTAIGEVIPDYITIFSVYGRMVTQLENLGNGHYIWTPSQRIPSGLYIARCIIENTVVTSKVLKL